MPELLLDDSDGTLVMLRDSVTGFAARFPGAKALRERRERGGTMDRRIWSAMAEAGWIGLLLPEDCGGAGLGLREQAVLRLAHDQTAFPSVAGARTGMETIGGTPMSFSQSTQNCAAEAGS